MSDLKPCPFCGGKASVSETTSMWMVECDNAECGSNPDVLRPFKYAAIEAWNRRTQPEATVPAEVEFVNRPGEASLILPVQDCTEPNRGNCPRRCIDFCNKAEQATATAQDLSAAILALELPSEISFDMRPKLTSWERELLVRGALAMRKAAAALASSANALSAVDRVDAAFSLADSMSISLEEPVQDALADFAKHQSAMAAARLVQSVAAILQSQKGG